MPTQGTLSWAAPSAGASVRVVLRLPQVSRIFPRLTTAESLFAVCAAGMRYPDIAAEVGDTLVFNYMPMHDVRCAALCLLRCCCILHALCVPDLLTHPPLRVAQVWSMPAAGCAFEGGLELAGADASPFRYTLASPGRFHFACSISSHCAGGQARGGALLSVCGQGSCVHCDRLTCDCSQAVSVDVAPSGSAQPQGATCARFLGVFTSC
jgi:hypothetical protein